MKTSALFAAFLAAGALAKPFDKRALAWVVTTTTVWEIEEPHTTRIVNEANLPTEVLASLSRPVEPGAFIAQSSSNPPAAAPSAPPAAAAVAAPAVQTPAAPAVAAAVQTQAPAAPVVAATSAAPAAPTAVATSAAVAAPAGNLEYSGDMTHYDPGLGACGWTNAAGDLVAALPHGMMGTQSNGNPFCGRMATLSYQGRSVTVKIVDKCMGCVGTSIDVSEPAFKALIPDYNPPNVDPGRVVISWGFTS